VRAATPGPRQQVALKALAAVGVGDIHQLHRAQRGTVTPEYALLGILDVMVARGWVIRLPGTKERWSLTPNGKAQLDGLENKA